MPKVSGVQTKTVSGLLLGSQSFIKEKEERNVSLELLKRERGKKGVVEAHHKRKKKEDTC
jgi:ribosomal protein L35AE/L33A